jgi:hypothetical protein
VSVIKLIRTKTLTIIVGVLAIAAALTGAVAVYVLLPAAHAVTSTSKDPSYGSKDPGKKNSIDIEKSTTDFSFKQKLKNNCSAFSTCSNAASETLGGAG